MPGNTTASARPTTTASEVYRSPEFRKLVEYYRDNPTPEVAAFDASAPPLAERQRERLAVLLTPVGAGSPLRTRQNRAETSGTPRTL